MTGKEFAASGGDYEYGVGCGCTSKAYTLGSWSCSLFSLSYKTRSEDMRTLLRKRVREVRTSRQPRVYVWYFDMTGYRKLIVV